MDTSPLPDGLDTALLLTGGFETSGDPWSDVTGDFDAEGISCGVLQWNIGQGSLQPLVRKAGQAVVMAAMPQFGAAFWQACLGTIPEALALVRSWQRSKRLDPAVKQELRALMGSSAMKDQQRAAVAVLAGRAAQLADDWAKTSRAGARTLHEFCWFFDLLTQNGGLKGLTYQNVDDFIAGHGAGKVLEVICDWLFGAPTSSPGWRDARHNADSWGSLSDQASVNLCVLSYLRAQKSIANWRYDVMNRKGSIAAKFGQVHGKAFDFRLPPFGL